MTWRTVPLSALASFALGIPTSEAEPRASEQCLTQCKENTEACIKAAGDDQEELQKCSAQALACIESCKS